MKKIYRKLKEWLSPQKYWYVAYLFSNSEGKLSGCAIQYVTSIGYLNPMVVAKDLTEMKSYHNVVVINYKQIGKEQYIDYVNK